MTEIDINKQVPTSKLGRGSIVVKAAAKASTQKLTAMANCALSNEENKAQIRDQSDEDIAKTIFKALGQLKGTALKAAQLFNMEVEYIPESWRRELAKACYQAPSLNKSVVRRIFHNQFQQYPEQLFRHFETTPSAAASLGQVHKAVDFRGNTLAVKIQYPGIADSIKSDLTMLGSLIKLLPSRYCAFWRFRSHALVLSDHLLT